MSIDWTPRNRAGMPTTVKVASGEMEVLNDTFSGELDGSFEDTREGLNIAVRNYFGSTENNNIYVWGKKTFPDYAIYQLDNNDKISLHKVYYEEKDDTINITKTEEVKEVVSYTSVSGEQGIKGGNGEMGETNNNNNNNNNVLPDNYKNVLGEMTAEELKTVLNDYNILIENESKRLHGEMVKKCVDSKIENEKVKKTVLELYTFNGETEEIINGEIDEVLKKDVIKDMLNTEYKGTKGTSNNEGKKFGFAGLKKA